MHTDHYKDIIIGNLQRVSMAKTGMGWMKNEITDTKSVKINSSHCLHRNEFRKKKKKNIQKHYKIPILGNIFKN